MIKLTEKPLKSIKKRLSSIVSDNHFRFDQSCVDYRSYVYQIRKDINLDQFNIIVQRLATLGRAENERMGVVYVRGPWGFFVIPRLGFPHLRISFFFDTPEKECIEMMKSISYVFNE